MIESPKQPPSAMLACALCGASTSWLWIDSSFTVPGGPCSQCGKGPSYIAHIMLADTISPIYDSVRGVVTSGNKGKKHWILDFFSGHQFSHRLGRFVQRIWRRERKPADVYEEVVIDPETGEVIHECKERLSEHHGHGSAKKGSPAAKQHTAPDVSAAASLRRSRK